MATKRTYDKVVFGMKDGTEVTVVAPYADAAMQNFQAAHKTSTERFIQYNDAAGPKYLNLDCVCTVTPGSLTEETVPGAPCNSVDCIADYTGG